jgi:hypothetical protein
MLIRIYKKFLTFAALKFYKGGAAQWKMVN